MANSAVVAVVFVGLLFGVVQGAIPAAEYEALMDFYRATGGPSWTSRDGWGDAGKDPCGGAWFGVTCDSAKEHVTGLFLARNNLAGPLPESLGNLSRLSGVDLGCNALTGPLPASFAGLTALYAISLRENALTGPLPFGRLAQMQFAHLDFNRFGGTLESFAGCPGLKVLGLTDNSLTGPVPPAFAKMAALETLFLGGNRLTGALPPLAMTTLTSLDVSRNELSGELPVGPLFAIGGLVELLAFGNKFSGAALGAATQHKSMVVLDAHGNALSGDLPAVLAKGLPNLDILRLQKNRLSGAIPADFQASSVYSIDVSGNPFFCPLPAWAPNATKAECRYWSLGSIAPAAGPVAGGYTVDLYGTDFVPGHANVLCSFGGRTAAATVLTETHATCTVPAAASAGVVSVTLLFGGQAIASDPVSFRYTTTAQQKAELRSVSKAPAAAAFPPVSVRIHGEQKCPDMASIESIFLPVLQDLGPDVLNLTIGWIAKKNPEYPTGFWSLHGQSEIIGNALVSCAEKMYGMTGALTFAGCLTKDITSIPSNACACALSLGLDDNALRLCALGDEGTALVEQAVDLADADGAVWSPTVMLNGELFCLWHSSPCKATTEKDFGKAVCDAYTGPKPAACNNYSNQQ